MKLSFYAKELHKYQTIEEPMFGGIHYEYHFPNRYGVSLVKHDYSYGSNPDLWEIAILKYDPVTDLYEICYDTPLSDDVLGHLTDAEALRVMGQTFVLDRD